MAEVERIPMIPQDPAGAFEWVLTHVIGLDTAQKRSRITVQGAVTTIRKRTPETLQELGL